MASSTTQVLRVSIDSNTAKVMAGKATCVQCGMPDWLKLRKGSSKDSKKPSPPTAKGPMMKGLPCKLRNSGHAVKASSQ